MPAKGEARGASLRPANLLGPAVCSRGLLESASGCCCVCIGVPKAPLLRAWDDCSAEPGRALNCQGDPAARGLLASRVILRALMSSYDDPAPSAHAMSDLLSLAWQHDHYVKYPGDSQARLAIAAHQTLPRDELVFHPQSRHSVHPSAAETQHVLGATAQLPRPDVNADLPPAAASAPAMLSALPCARQDRTSVG